MKKLMAAAVLLLALGGCKTTHVAHQAQAGMDKQFSIVVLPDIQYYTAIRHGGTMQMLDNQINWILKNKEQEQIKYVIQLGDITDNNTPDQWQRAKDEFYKLDAKNIPYSLAVGNHDQTPNGKPALGADTTSYTKYFGKQYFSTKSWYGGNMGSNNNRDNHFDLINAGGEAYIILYLVYNDPGGQYYYHDYEQQTLRWADSVLAANNNRKAIIVSHNLLGKPETSTSDIKPDDGKAGAVSPFTKQGQHIYDRVKNHNNVVLMLGGHVAGEGVRKDVANGHAITSILADYQSRRNAPYKKGKDRNGGNGLMRIMRFNTADNTVKIETFSPQTNGGILRETDGDSKFTISIAH